MGLLEELVDLEVLSVVGWVERVLGLLNTPEWIALSVWACLFLLGLRTDLEGRVRKERYVFLRFWGEQRKRLLGQAPSLARSIWGVLASLLLAELDNKLLIFALTKLLEGAGDSRAW